MDRSSFVLVFGESPFIKVLDFFLNNEDFDYPISYIAKETESKWETIDKVLIILIKKGVVKKTRKLGKAWLYTLDKTSNLSKLLIDIDMKISEFFLNKEIKNQKVKVDQ